MENEITNTNEAKRTCFDNTSKLQLDGARKWARVFAVIGFIFLVISFLAAIIIISTKLLPGTSEFSDLRMGFLPIVGIVYIIILAFYFFILFYLYRFSSLAGRAINSNNSNYLAQSFSFLRKHYFLIVLIIILYIVLAFVLGIVTFSTAMKEFGSIS